MKTIPSGLYHCLGVVFGILLMLAPINPALADENEIRVLARSDYLPAAVIEQFERESGQKLRYTVYSDSEEAFDYEQLAADYDLFLAPPGFLATLIEASAVHRLEHGRIENMHLVSRQVQRALSRYSDVPFRIYGVPYIWGTTGIGFNTVEARIRLDGVFPTRLANIFDPELVRKFADCGVGVIDAPGEVVRTAALYSGQDPMSSDPMVLTSAQTALSEIRPYIRKIGGHDLSDDLAKGDLCLVFMWSGDAMRAHMFNKGRSGGKEIGYVIPEDGSPVWVDLFAVSARGQNTDGTYDLINFLMQGSIAAKVSAHALYPTVIVSAQAINWDAGLMQDRRVFPKWEILDNQFTVPVQSDETTRLIERIWNDFKAAVASR